MTAAHTADLQAQIRNTHPGMAAWAGTGPIGKQCQDCKHFEPDNKRQRGVCAAYRRMTGHKGAKVPSLASACRYFQDK